MDNLQLSVLDLVPIFAGADAQKALSEAVRLAQSAERLGYTRYWVPEHHDMKALASACPEVLLAHIGAHTRTIRIGSGAVLLPHYKPLKVAEAFHLLATLYPDRIDLGIGRAPGGSAHASMALNDYLQQVRQFPEALHDLVELLGDQYRVAGQSVSAWPVPSVPPQLWMLGTNVKGAQYAAEYGTGYVFGQFMSDGDGKAIIDDYRRNFRTSALQQLPKSIVAVGAVCAETQAEAEQLAEGVKGFISGNADPKRQTSPQKRMITGDPRQIKVQLMEIQAYYGVDEIMLVSMIPDYDKRIRSYELIAEAVLHGGS